MIIYTNKRTSEQFTQISYNEELGVYTLKNIVTGEVKEAAKSTVKRWYKIEVTVDPKEEEKPKAEPEIEKELTEAEVTKIKDKIQKLLNLAGNNPSEEEAKAALLKAQKLMAKYNLTSVEAEGEEIEYSLEGCDVRAHARYNALAVVIANSFGVKCIIVNRKIHFFGRKAMAEAAMEAFKFAIHVMRVNARHLAISKGMEPKTEGWAAFFTTYASGFVAGIKDDLDAQCKALAIVVPEDVNTEFGNRFSNTKMYKNRAGMNGDYAVYSKGYTDGKSTMNKRSLNA